MLIKLKVNITDINILVTFIHLFAAHQFYIKLLFFKCLAGVDESVVVVMKFSRNRMAFCAFSIAARLPNDAVIAGTKGSIKVCYASLVQGHYT